MQLARTATRLHPLGRLTSKAFYRLKAVLQLTYYKYMAQVLSFRFFYYILHYYGFISVVRLWTYSRGQGVTVICMYSLFDVFCDRWFDVPVLIDTCCEVSMYVN